MKRCNFTKQLPQRTPDCNGLRSASTSAMLKRKWKYFETTVATPVSQRGLVFSYWLLSHLNPIVRFFFSSHFTQFIETNAHTLVWGYRTRFFFFTSSYVKMRWITKYRFKDSNVLIIWSADDFIRVTRWTEEFRWEEFHVFLALYWDTRYLVKKYVQAKFYIWDHFHLYSLYFDLLKQLAHFLFHKNSPLTSSTPREKRRPRTPNTSNHLLINTRIIQHQHPHFPNANRVISFTSRITEQIQRKLITSANQTT